MQTFDEKYSYNPYKQYGSEIESILAEKKYNEDLSNLIRLSFPVMIEYYGHEYKDIILDTLKDTTIEMIEGYENLYDTILKHTPKNIEKRYANSSVGIDEYKRASGVHYTFPILSEENGTINLKGKHDIVSFKNSKNKLYLLTTFVHEFSHAFKSYQNGIKLLQNESGENILATRAGISTTYSNVYLQDGKIIVEDGIDKNLGLEEGINVYDENNIINKIISMPLDSVPEQCRNLKKSLVLPEGKSTYQSLGYVQESLCADKLLNNCRFRPIIRKDQFLGTNNSERIYNSITQSPTNTWENLNSKIDLALKHTYARFKNIFNFGWFDEHKDEIVGNLREIHDLLDECTDIIEQNKDSQNLLNEFN